ncbi:MAG: carboxymuconolactone decarboxylase family protein [Roseovarius sp.]|nr:carboxymuconolactone decarboxylase family protein [Roseovarius sp.]
MKQVDDLLEQVRNAYPEGVPNMFRTLTGNRAVLAGFMALDERLDAEGVLDPAERLMVGLITAQHVDCSYCQAALSREAREAGAEPEIVTAILRNALPNPLRARALVQATQRILETHGRLPRAEIAHFAGFGLDEEALLEVIAVIGEFTIATHANNLVRTRIDPEYRDAGQG